MPVSRRLAAILAADVVGYSRMMGEDETGTAAAVRESREAAQPMIVEHGGRIFKTMGDGFLVEFPSVVAAVACALAVQADTARRNDHLPDARRLTYRMGIHLGDVLVEGDDLIGDGVNIAARLEAIAPPGGVCMSGTAHENVRGRLDVALTDLGERTLKNIARPVRVYATAAAGTREGGAAAPAARAGAPRLSMVVLPFANLGGGPEQEYFVDGVTESLTTDLSRISGATVIARNTAFAYRGKAVDVREIGRDLNVRYVLEGSVQRSGDRMRVNVQLIEAETGTHLWAERFDKPVAGLFDMQDEIVARIANQLSAEIVRAEARRAETSAKPDAIDFWLRGYDWINRGVNPKSWLRPARASSVPERSTPQASTRCSASSWSTRSENAWFLPPARPKTLPRRRRWRSGRWRSSRATPGRTMALLSSFSFRAGRRRRSPSWSRRLRSIPIWPSPTPRSASPSAFSAAPRRRRRM